MTNYKCNTTFVYDKNNIYTLLVLFTSLNN